MKIVSKVLAAIIICYAFTLNGTLVLSMITGLIIAIVVVLTLELGDEDIMNQFSMGEFTENMVQKYNEILLMGLCIFLVATTLIYELFTNK